MARASGDSLSPVVGELAKADDPAGGPYHDVIAAGGFGRDEDGPRFSSHARGLWACEHRSCPTRLSPPATNRTLSSVFWLRITTLPPQPSQACSAILALVCASYGALPSGPLVETLILFLR
ncbi:hypothetical protein KM043_010954 [Ampulex compressa]|nr:hypothetical protein KM043_010954 [Ampulex compressa]